MIIIDLLREFLKDSLAFIDGCHQNQRAIEEILY